MLRTALVFLALTACTDPVTDDDDDAAPSLIQVGGVDVQKVTINQAIDRVVWEDGDDVHDGPSIIAGRDTLVRVHAVENEAWDRQNITARLWVGDEHLDTDFGLTGDPSDDDLDTTINFEVPGDLIEDPFDWTLQILQEGTGVDDQAGRFDGEVDVDGDINVFRMVIAPFSYEFDGSGRLPDTSPEQVEHIRETFLKVYPVSDVEISVREPNPITVELEPNGNGWISAGIPLIGYRQEDGASDDVYYYGMFNPAETVQGYCGFGGCLLGVTLLNNDPPDTGSVTLRVALGVGFVDKAAWVAAHEIGHSHGRPHTPCGPANNPPADVDPGYPYPDGTIGTWGWDLITGDLVPPETTDFMGYCEEQWTSEYTWEATHARGQNVNRGYQSLPVTDWDVIAVTREGAEWATSISRRGTWAGEDVDLTVDGVATKGRYVAWDHMPGGLLVFPKMAGDKADFVLDGVAHTARR